KVCPLALSLRVCVFPWASIYVARSKTVNEIVWSAAVRAGGTSTTLVDCTPELPAAVAGSVNGGVVSVPAGVPGWLPPARDGDHDETELPVNVTVRVHVVSDAGGCGCPAAGAPCAGTY